MLKYFNPKNYIRKFSELKTRFSLKYDKHFVKSTSCLGYSISFLLDSWKEYQLRLGSSYTGEPTTIYWIEDLVEPNDIIYDIGANVGAYSLLIGKKIQSKKGTGKVLAFEPESSNFYKLNRNIQLNGLSQVITPLCMAFGKKHSLDKFFLQSLEIGSACHGLGDPKSEGKAFIPKHCQGVISYSLDEFVFLNGAPFPNHIKIDVDGLEDLILQNAIQVLKNKSVKTLIVEINEEISKGELEILIGSCGFEEVKRDQWKNDKGISTFNILYVKNKVDNA